MINSLSNGKFGGGHLQLEGGLVGGRLFGEIEEGKGGESAQQLDTPVQPVTVMAAQHKGQTVPEGSGHARIAQNGPLGLGEHRLEREKKDFLRDEEKERGKNYGLENRTVKRCQNGFITFLSTLPHPPFWTCSGAVEEKKRWRKVRAEKPKAKHR